MAITLKKNLVSDLSAIVAGAINSAKNEKAVRSAKVEADFQKAIADGSMGYAAQILFRKKQLEEEKNSPFSNQELISDLETSIASTKKLDRYDKYRTKYLTNYTEMKAGRLNAQEQLNFLKDQLNTTSDPDLKQEILTNISTTEQELKNYNDTIISNNVTKALNDKTETVLSDTIKLIQDKRALASLNGNEEEVSAYDVNLGALKSQLNKTITEDTMNKIEINTTLKGSTPISKIDQLNRQINNADDEAPITIDNKRFASAKDYWTNVRDNYIAGSGSGVFANFNTDMTNDYETRIAGAQARDGYVNPIVLDTFKSDFTNLKSRPEFQPFLNKITDLESVVMSTALDSTAKRIIDFTSSTGDVKNFQDADTYLTEYGKKYGVDTQNYKLDLNQKLSNLGASTENTAAVKTAAEKLTPEKFPIPTITPEVTPTPITPSPITVPKAGGLTIGSEGADVMKLQEKLGIKADGVFGQNTLAAVKAFQTNNGLTPDGIVGSITSKKLEEVAPVAKIEPVVPTKIETPVIQKPVTPKVEEQKIVTPTISQPKTYTVAKGDTISAIANKLKTTVDKITGYKSGDPNKINVGETLTIK